MRVLVSNEVAELLDERGLLEEDLEAALSHCDEGGVVFRHRDDPQRFLARSLEGNLNVYVDFRACPDGYRVRSAYAHRVMIDSDCPDKFPKRDDLKEGTESEWVCNRCDVSVGDVSDVNVHYADVSLAAVDGFRCPQCGGEMISEFTYTTMLFMSERMLEAK